LELDFRGSESMECLAVVLDERVDGFDRGGRETNGEEVVNEANDALVVRRSEVLLESSFRLGGCFAVRSEVVDRWVDAEIDDAERNRVSLVPRSCVVAFLPWSLQAVENGENRSSTGLEDVLDLPRPGVELGGVGETVVALEEARIRVERGENARTRRGRRRSRWRRRSSG